MTNGFNKYINEKYLDEQLSYDIGENDLLFEYDSNTLLKNTPLISKKISGIKMKLDTNTNIYPISQMLKFNIDEVECLNSTVNLCIFRIVTRQNSLPFLQYLLYKDDDMNILRFPSFNSNDSNINNLIRTANSMYENIIGSHTNFGIENYKGLHVSESGEIFIFYNYVDTRHGIIEPPYKKEDDEWWWCLMDEICNWRKVLSFEVSPDVVSLFYKNPNFIYLYKQNYDKIEIPIVAYYVDEYNKLEYTYIFGVDSLRSYFTTYTNALKLLSSNTHKGLVRFALFMNDMSLIERRENHQINQEIIDCNNLLEDSIFFGYKSTTECEYFVKTDFQKLSLSIHIIDK